MSGPASIRARLLLGAAVLMLAFLVGAGAAVQRAHENSVRAAHYARLQSTLYLLLAAAEVDAQGRLVMPPALAEPRLSLPGSGLYASIHNLNSGGRWESASALGIEPPFRAQQPVGEWRFETVAATQPTGPRRFLSASYGVRWNGSGADTRLALSVLEDRAAFERELAVFERTLWAWLGGAALLLLLAQSLLLQGALAPLRRMAAEIRRIESGAQGELAQDYPRELAPLARNLNALIRQERVRQTRFQEALSFLAHSLKTPLAVLRTALGEPAQLPEVVGQQVDRMDDIVQHQLARARAASAAAPLVAPLALAPVLRRIEGSLAKVHGERALAFTLDCPDTLEWRMDEGDAFELLGNLMDNAAKWARTQVAVQVRRDDAGLHLAVDDDGPGFSDTQAVLQLHVRGDERVPGHGVGLAMVKTLVDAHGGTLVLGQGPLGGARVSISLPG
ncbi:ATP-binding protein [Ramlibacter rhizophilus]|uniref:histidine kinase n=1 Tax=Ramlibacter rhizophilus TaxID=1781167 RepID=A0A4Z0BF92_9BURK|nr:ATP-binding protein [Ramlibacter rhizophilus]TFY96794.1 histidine kinase [Ramlibacter rhizophilus]